jgi:hypothetical protein
MSMLQCRGSIALAAVVVALFSSGPAGAQVVVVPGPREPVGLLNPPGLGTGVLYDVVNQEKAERRLHHLQGKLRRDAERGDPAAVDRDAWWIGNVKQRIAVDEWLIRKNTLHDPGCYPLRIDAMSLAAIAQATHPLQVLDPSRLQTVGPTAAAPSIGITILNAGPAGASIAYTIDGIARESAGGSRRDLIVAPGSTITYDGGGTLGRRQYRLSPGLFEFRSTAEGWALYQLPDMP